MATNSGRRADFLAPIERMSGRWAVKQKDVAYSGEEKGSLLPTDGKKTSTNYKKMFVGTFRNGVARFYVKTKSSINNNPEVLLSKAAMAAACSSYANIMKNESLVVSLRAYYKKAKQWGDVADITFRQFIFQPLYWGLRNKQDVITIGENTYDTLAPKKFSNNYTDPEGEFTLLVQSTVVFNKTKAYLQ